MDASGAFQPASDGKKMERMSGEEALLNADEEDALAEAPSMYFYVAVLISCFGAFVFGCALGFTSPTLSENKVGKSSMCPIPGTNCSISEWECGNPKMGSKMNCDLQFDSNFQSIFGSIVNIGCLVGALCGGSFVDKFGKKIGMMVALGIHVVGWFLIYIVPSPDTDTWDGDSSGASNVSTIDALLIVARLLLGFAVGISCCSVSNYQTEICTVSLRGAIGTCFQLFVVIGLFMVYLIGEGEG